MRFNSSRSSSLIVKRPRSAILRKVSARWRSITKGPRPSIHCPAELRPVEGKIELAKVQLAALRNLCGTDCEDYEDLANAIQSAQH